MPSRSTNRRALSACLAAGVWTALVGWALVVVAPAADPSGPNLDPEPPVPPQFGEELLSDTFQEPPSPNDSPLVEPDPPPPGYETSPDPGYGYGAPRRRPVRNYIEQRPRQVPLRTDSWLNRPLSASYFFGGMFLDDPIAGVVAGDTGYTMGGRFGWDLSPNVGVEMRGALASIGVVDQLNGIDLAPADLYYWDIDWLWYFTGDTRWRPYVLVGGGILNIDYTDGMPVRHHGNFFELPFGVGMKYRHGTRLALRIDLLDNYVFSGGVQSGMHNISATAGMELRFGGSRQRNYWPWNPGRNWW